MKRFLSVVLLSIILVSNVLAFIPQPVNAATDWYNASWLYRKSFNVLGSSDGTQTNYQLKVHAYFHAGTDTGFVLREPTSGNYSTDATTNTTTIVDAALTSTVDNYYVGAKVYNVTRALWSVVTAYTASTKTLTISPAIAAQVATDAYYLYEIPPVMYFNGKCQEDFDDIRFTRSDGLTKLDHWVESYTASTSAIIWVEFNTLYQATLTTPNNTFWVYYGNAAATSVSNGENTFITFDDFDFTGAGVSRGADGDTIGGAWTEVTAHVHISTDVNSTSITSTGVAGTRSAKLIGVDVGANPAATIPSVYSANKAFGFKIYKENASIASMLRGNAAEQWMWRYNTDEIISYFDVGWNTTGLTMTADAWQTVEVKNFNTSTNNAQIELNGRPSNLANTNAAASSNDVFYLYGGNAAAGTVSGLNNDTYIDDYYERNFTVNEPRWSTFTAEVTLGPLPTIQDVKVFESYKVTGDWLIVIRFLNAFYPYYDTYDIRQYFVAQFCNAAGTVVAQTPLVMWGNKIGSIYLSASSVTVLDWGNTSYTVKIYGLFTGNPATTYTLKAADWIGADLTYLDSWVISSASVIEDYYSASNLILTDYVANRGEVLNATGGTLFDTGIPGLSSVRPGIFQTVTTPNPYTETNHPQTTRTNLAAWQVAWGADGVIWLTRVGNMLGGLSGDRVSTGLFLLFGIIVAMIGIPKGNGIMAAIVMIVVIVASSYFGTDFIWIAIMASVAFALAAKQVIWDK